uniref:hypothetical protein n=1 Tax=Pedobacter schmidteae TaxID=2201271 RepID=UPI0013CF2EA3|nr:hypothetical protein [Pedobacter schmidteae]
MKNRKLQPLFLFFCACLMGWAGNLYAQSDYVIKHDNTKVMGEIKSHGLSKVKFIPAGEKKAQKFRPEQLKEAYQAGHGVRRSIVREKGGKASFLEVLEDGKVKLYEYYQQGRTMYGPPTAGGGMGFVGGSAPTKKWYAQKDDGIIVEVKSNGIWGSRKGRKDNFLSLIQDNAQVVSRYEKEDKFSFDFVRSLIVEYNAAKAKEIGR